MGQLARLQHFQRVWMASAENKDRVLIELQRINANDKKLQDERKAMKLEDRWKIELNEAFDLLAKTLRLVIDVVDKYSQPYDDSDGDGEDDEDLDEDELERREALKEMKMLNFTAKRYRKPPYKPPEPSDKYIGR